MTGIYWQHLCQFILLSYQFFWSQFIVWLLFTAWVKCDVSTKVFEPITSWLSCCHFSSALRFFSCVILERCNEYTRWKTLYHDIMLLSFLVVLQRERESNNQEVCVDLFMPELAQISVSKNTAVFKLCNYLQC